jgi:hypothetical protein
MRMSRRSEEEILPRAISSGPRESFDEERDEGWFVYFKAGCHRIAMDLWYFVRKWFDSWLMVVVTGCVIGAIIGLVYRWILLPGG